MILLTEYHYFSPVILFKKVIEISNVEFDIYDVHRKMSFRNRCVLAGSDGPVNLSIPLVKGREQRKPAGEVRIDNKTDWQAQHWKTITSCYNRSPWFEFYKHDLEILFQQPTDLLVDWNRQCWRWIIEKLTAQSPELRIQSSETKQPLEFQTWNTERNVSRPAGNIPGPERNVPGLEDNVQDFQTSPAVSPIQNPESRTLNPKPETRNPKRETRNPQPATRNPKPETRNPPPQLIDWRNKLLPRTISEIFEPVTYRQVFEDRTGFLPHLSILDLLFCEGPASVEVLKSSKIPI
jgi:hypothetical protein